MKIRLAQNKDYIAIVRMHRATIRHINSKDYPEDIISVWSGRSNVDLFRSSEARVKRWVAVEKGIGDKEKIIGFCDHNFNCELGGLYVHKDYIGKGVGSRLLEKAEVSLVKCGCNKITIKSTLTAKEFYLKQGYKVVKKSFHLVNDQKLPIFIMAKNY